MKKIITGLEDSGKSYRLAQIFIDLVYRNAKWLQIQEKDYQELGSDGFLALYGHPTPVPRPIVSILPLKERAFDFAKSLGIPVVDWSNSRQVVADLETLHSCDLIMDEVGTYFDSRTFKELPLSTRLWLAQASKLGVDIYGAAQDFSQIDISFRRLTNDLEEVTKIIGSMRPDKTRPPVSKIWGLCMSRELSPVGYDEKNKYAGSKGLPGFFFLQEKYTQVFDTNKRVPKAELPPYKHSVRRCEDPSCGFELYKSVHGVKHKITHT